MLTAQVRCVSLAYVKFMKTISLSEEVVRRIKETPSSHFYEMPVNKIAINELDALLSQYVGNGCFILGDTTYEFKVRHIEVILGIPNEDRKIIEKKNQIETSALGIMFQPETRVKRAVVERKLKEIMEGKEHVDIDIVVKL